MMWGDCITVTWSYRIKIKNEECVLESVTCLQLSQTEEWPWGFVGSMEWVGLWWLLVDHRKTQNPLLESGLSVCESRQAQLDIAWRESWSDAMRRWCCCTCWHTRARNPRWAEGCEGLDRPNQGPVPAPQLNSCHLRCLSCQRHSCPVWHAGPHCWLRPFQQQRIQARIAAKIEVHTFWTLTFLQHSVLYCTRPDQPLNVVLFPF